MDEIFLFLLVQQLIIRPCLIAFVVMYYSHRRLLVRGCRPRRTVIMYSLVARISGQIKYLDDALNKKDSSCKNNFRMNRACFEKLCTLLQSVGGLRPSKYVNVSEKIGMFLDIISHHTKNCRISHHYDRSGKTDSKFFKRVMAVLLKLYPMLISHPDPVGPNETNFT